MLTVIVAIFVLAYAAIAVEHPLRLHGSASSLTGTGAHLLLYRLAPAPERSFETVSPWPRSTASTGSAVE